jgi:hypothetical protein
MRLFILGAGAMACAIAGLLFLRFWRRTQDRFFLLFALAFWVLSLNRVGLALIKPVTEPHNYLYGVRLAAFVLILVAIADKNRRP